MSFFINQTDFFGIIINGLTVNITGSFDLSMFVVFLLLLTFALSFGLPVEYVIPVLLPFVIVLMAVSSNLFFIGGVMVFIIVIVIVRSWFV